MRLCLGTTHSTTKVVVSTLFKRQSCQGDLKLFFKLSAINDDE